MGEVYKKNIIISMLNIDLYLRFLNKSVRIRGVKLTFETGFRVVFM